jgi:hypothetical protein
VADEKSRQLIFEAFNRHGVTEGLPPHISTDVSGNYYGYYENEYGEQFIFVYERAGGKGTLWLGDNGWETPEPVIDGHAPNIVLSKPELMWLLSCWLSATGTTI